MSYFKNVNITQNVIASTLNSVTGVTLATGATWSGTGETTLGVNSIQINFQSDQNFHIDIYQSMDNVNWDIKDEFNFYNSLGGNSWTVQATASYFKVEITNIGYASNTILRLQTALCPIVEALPRSLSEGGHLKTTVLGISDEYGWSVENTNQGEIRTVVPVRLVGGNFSTDLDDNYWTSGGTGLVTVANAEVILTGATTLQSSRTARYIGGVGIRFRGVTQLSDLGVAGNYRRMGAFSTTDGAFFEISGTTFNLVTRKNSVDTKVSNGSFNGELGNTFMLDTNISAFEIYWTNSKVFFVNSDSIIHTVNADTTTWSATMNLPIRLENSGTTTNTAIYARSLSIFRLGNLLTQPTSKYFSGQTAGVLYKNGPGNLHGMIIGAASNGSKITLYDGTSTGGTILFSTTTIFPGGGNFNPISLDLKGIPFFTGLFMVVATANSSLSLLYE